jgi:hypothetical protein
MVGEKISQRQAKEARNKKRRRRMIKALVLDDVYIHDPEDNIFACYGFGLRSSTLVGILASDMAYRVPRRGFDPGLQVFLCQHQGARSSCGSDLLLFTRLDARASA